MRSRFTVSFWFLAGLTLFALLDRSFLAPHVLGVIVLHEGVHLAVMRLLGARVRSVDLRLYGARIDADLSGLSPAGRAAVYLSAPLANLLLGGLLYLCDPQSIFGVCSVCVGAFNLAPIPPLDGGNAARELWTSPRAARIQRAAAVLALLAAGAGAAALCAVRGNFTLLVCVAYLIVMLDRQKGRPG